MTQHFEQELARLKRSFLAHATSCLDALERAHDVLRDGDTKLAERVIADDDRLDEQEVRIEVECVRLLTLHHPVAQDMRLLITMLKLNDEFERIADHAVNICRLARKIVKLGGRVPPHLQELSDTVIQHSRDVYRAFLDQDLQLARKALCVDDVVDVLDRTVRHEVYDMLAEDQEVRPALHAFRLSREFERVGDRLANVAEDTIYLITGEIVRHHLPEAGSSSAE